MAESPEGLHDSRFSVWGPHTTTRGASAPAVLGDLAAAERHPEFRFILFHRGSPKKRTEPPGRNGLPLVLRFHVQPCWSDVNPDPCSETSPVPDAFSSASRGEPIGASACLVRVWGLLLATLLRAKHCDLAAQPAPLSPPCIRGVLVPRALRSRPGSLSIAV